MFFFFGMLSDELDVSVQCVDMIGECLNFLSLDFDPVVNHLSELMRWLCFLVCAEYSTLHHLDIDIGNNGQNWGSHSALMFLLVTVIPVFEVQYVVDRQRSDRSG